MNLFLPLNTPAKHALRAAIYSLLFSLSPAVHAQPPSSCDCLWQGPFSDAYTNADIVIAGKVMATRGNSIDVQVLSRLTDPPGILPDFIDNIRIWGDNGRLCRPDITHFGVNTEWVLALFKIEEVPDGGFDPATPSLSYGRKGDFYLSHCGAYWLSKKDNFVSGNITASQRWTWDAKKSNPVLIDLIQAYINKTIPKQALTEAAKPPSELKQLMQQTKQFLEQQ